ncbi:hypothetical protein [Dehalobacter sp. TeCB1]|uniref:hypothetical protein n=1 Tax=Dehalobacter sp. TeCB1 TaxID=1843715 RepID=UPI00083ACC41|nr:hypothetical protein [Dehalobacter sp. TeCB1]OCZ49727.1 hypothetical protein A7D23_02545 [Dehalobacter sp. TeCB1]
MLKKLAEDNQGKRTDLTSGRNLQEVDKPIHTRDELAKIAGVSHDTYGKGKKILELWSVAY